MCNTTDSQLVDWWEVRSLGGEPLDSKWAGGMCNTTDGGWSVSGLVDGLQRLETDGDSYSSHFIKPSRWVRRS